MFKWSTRRKLRGAAAFLLRFGQSSAPLERDQKSSGRRVLPRVRGMCERCDKDGGAWCWCWCPYPRRQPHIATAVAAAAAAARLLCGPLGVAVLISMVFKFCTQRRCRGGNCNRGQSVRAPWLQWCAVVHNGASWCVIDIEHTCQIAPPSCKIRQVGARARILVGQWLESKPAVLAREVRQVLPHAGPATAAGQVLLHAGAATAVCRCYCTQGPQQRNSSMQVLLYRASKTRHEQSDCW